MMKIGIVSPYSWTFPGGVNEHIRVLQQRLRERGHAVKVLAPLDEYKQPVNIEQGDFVSLGRTLPVPANRSTAHLSLYPAGLRRAWREARAGGFDLLHLHEPLVPGSSLAALLAARTPVVATFHAFREEGSAGYALAAPLLRRWAGRIDKRIAVSKAARSFAARYFPGEFEIVPNGYDERLFLPGDRVPWAKGGLPVLLFVGREEPRKGLSVLLQALPRILQAHPDVRLEVAGIEAVSLSLLKTVPAAARERVTCLGRLSGEGLADAYRRAWLMAAPSLGQESFGIILAEAMGAGAPVIASDIEGYRAVAGEAVKLVRPGDAAALSSGIIDLLERPEALGRMRDAGLARAPEFAWGRVVEEVEAVYLKALR
jgi:phosphatidylinositol alpha-mannosyltransferase